MEKESPFSYIQINYRIIDFFIGIIDTGPPRGTPEVRVYTVNMLDFTMIYSRIFVKSPKRRGSGKNFSLCPPLSVYLYNKLNA